MSTPTSCITACRHVRNSNGADTEKGCFTHYGWVGRGSTLMAKRKRRSQRRRPWVVSAVWRACKAKPFKPSHPFSSTRLYLKTCPVYLACLASKKLQTDKESKSKKEKQHTHTHPTLAVGCTLEPSSPELQISRSSLARCLAHPSAIWINQSPRRGGRWIQPITNHDARNGTEGKRKKRKKKKKCRQDKSLIRTFHRRSHLEFSSAFDIQRNFPREGNRAIPSAPRTSENSSPKPRPFIPPRPLPQLDDNRDDLRLTTSSRSEPAPCDDAVDASAIPPGQERHTIEALFLCHHGLALRCYASRTPQQVTLGAHAADTKK